MKAMAARVGKIVLVVLLFTARTARAEWWTFHHLEIPAPWTPAQGQLPPPPISKVRIMLVTSDVPNGTIILGSSTTSIQLIVPAVGSTSSWPPPPQPDGVDRVTVTSLARGVVIDLEPNSMLDASKCQNIGGPKTYVLTWNSANVEGTRLTSYYGVNTGTATAPQCGLCSVRANQSALQASWTEPTVKLGRNPTDVVLVLDKSGSMGDPMSPTSQVPKWEALKSSVNAFIDSWKIESGPNALSGLEEDRLAMVLFDSYTHTRSDENSGLPFFVARGGDATGGAWNTFSEYLAAFIPSGATAMGQGLGVAYMNKDSQPSTALLRDTTFLLVTDGLQNVPPMVEGLELNTDLTLAVGGTTKVLKNQCVPIHTISVGAPPDADRLLNAISSQTEGQYGQAMSPDLSDMNGFVSTLKDALGGYSVVDTTGGTAVLPSPPVAPAGGVTPVAADTVVRTLDAELDSSIRSAMVILQWVPFTAGSPPMDIRVRSPNGIISPSARAAGAGYVIARLDLPQAGPAGTWSFDVMTAALSSETNYQLTVLANDKSLGLETRVAGVHHLTGQPLTIATYVGLDGVPVDGKAKLEATLTRPATALGTILHDAQVSTQASTAGGDPRSPYEAKVRAVLSDPVLRERALKKDKKEKLKFKHAGHGLYELTLESVDVPGTYRFDITLELPMPKGERIHRVDTVQTVVEAALTDPNALVNPLGRGRYEVQMAPRDAFGQYAGPGKKLVGTVSRGHVARVVDPQTRGEYVVELADVTGNPTLTLTLDGTPLGSKPLSQWDSRPQQRPWDAKPQVQRGELPIRRSAQSPAQRRPRLIERRWR